MSQEPRPYNRPSTISPAERIARPAETDRHDVEVAVEMNRRALGRSGLAPEDVDPRMLGRVFDSSRRRQQMHFRPVRAQLVTDQRRACLVFVTGRIDRRNANQPRRKVDDLIARAIDFRQHAIDLHAVIV